MESAYASRAVSSSPKSSSSVVPVSETGAGFVSSEGGSSSWLHASHTTLNWSSSGDSSRGAKTGAGAQSAGSIGPSSAPSVFASSAAAVAAAAALGRWYTTTRCANAATAAFGTALRPSREEASDVLSPEAPTFSSASTLVRASATTLDSNASLSATCSVISRADTDADPLATKTTSACDRVMAAARVASATARGCSVPVFSAAATTIVTRSSNRSRTAGDLLPLGGGISDSNALRRANSTLARNCAPSSWRCSSELAPFFFEVFFVGAAAAVSAATRSFSADSTNACSTRFSPISRRDSLPSRTA
mmetsp:Transcript_11928/g.44377  ORF Transcript_11928/g.44377 Transcript_11928/m.44377 type:complete len:306 (-) Transcript_11928:2248-3165(-)